MRTLRLVVAVLVAGVALSACGDADGIGTPTPSPTATGESPATPPPPSPSTPPAASTPPAGPTASPKTPGGPTLPPPVGGTTVTGTVTTGVEPNCLLLGEYLLVGGPKDVLKPGVRVAVSGRVQPDMMTTCQQGIPLLVESARPA